MSMKTFVPLLLAVSLDTVVMAHAATASTGSIGFVGKVFMPTEVVSIGADGHVPSRRAAAHISSLRLLEAKPAFHVADANDLFDYFAGYAPSSARVVTVVYH